MITNETIINAAKAARIDLIEQTHDGKLIRVLGDKVWTWFRPQYDDTDNAMIMDGAEIDIEYAQHHLDESRYLVCATSWGKISRSEETIGGNKAQARREAVILCAAAKYDAMNGEVK